MLYRGRDRRPLSSRYVAARRTLGNIANNLAKIDNGIIFIASVIIRHINYRDVNSILLYKLTDSAPPLHIGHYLIKGAQNKKKRKIILIICVKNHVLI